VVQRLSLFVRILNLQLFAILRKFLIVNFKEQKLNCTLLYFIVGTKKVLLIMNGQ
jgi:hypothetical protein